MKTMTRNTLAALALASSLGLGVGISANAAPAIPQAQAGQNGDHSSGAGQAISDAWITTKVKSELATTKGVKSMKIDVDTKDGVVTLTGVLATDTAVKKAVAAAKSVKGVKRVDASGLKVK